MSKKAYKRMRQLERAGTTGQKYDEMKKRYKKLSAEEKKKADDAVKRELLDANTERVYLIRQDGSNRNKL